jgi:Ca2+-binding RTX toxin-like protein
MGGFFTAIRSDADRGRYGAEDGIVVHLEVTEQEDGGFEITGVEYTPIWVDPVTKRVLPVGHSLLAGAGSASVLERSMQRTVERVNLLRIGGMTLSPVPWPEVSCRGKTATILGTPGDDVILGTPGDDIIVTRDGNDTIWAGDGNDTICGGNGDDNVYGGNGDDHITGGDGNDLLLGNDGRDTITGGNGNDRIRGLDDPDLLLGGPGDDHITGGDGNDLLWGGPGNDHTTQGTPIRHCTTLTTPCQ